MLRAPFALPMVSGKARNVARPRDRLPLRSGPLLGCAHPGLNGDSILSANSYDAIVIGGGHNGLVAAAYLAKYGARTVVLEARHKTGGAADTMAPWPEAPDIKVTTLSYVMSLMPPSIQRDLGLERFGYKVFPQGHGYLPLPDGSILQSGDEAQGPRVDREVLQARRRPVAEVRGVDRPHREHHGTAPDGDAAARRVEEGGRHQGRRAARVAAPQGGRPADGRRHHAAVHDERHRPAPALVRERGVHRPAVGERDHRHVVGSRCARHGVRDDASLRRRHRRRRDRELGLSRGRHGRGRRRVRLRGAVVRCRDPHERAGRAGADPRRPRGRRRARRRRGAVGAARRHRDPPEDHVPRADRTVAAARRRSSRTSRAGARAPAP